MEDGGIDLDNLTEVSWKEGTGILAKQDGELKQLVLFIIYFKKLV